MNPVDLDIKGGRQKHREVTPRPTEKPITKMFGNNALKKWLHFIEKFGLS